MLKRILASALLFFFFLPLPAAAPPEEPAAENPAPLDTGLPYEALQANAVIFYNVETDTLLYEKNADGVIHPASTTKILSVALAMELCGDLQGTLVTIPDGVWGEFEGINISHANLQPGEQITMYDLLCCMMIQSANEAASALANYYGREDFVQMMNDKASELGCTNSHFSNPHGLSADDHYTTARDMLKITQWAIGVPGFWEMSQQSRYLRQATNLNPGEWLTTTVLMQDTNSTAYYAPYIRGIKTGTTDEAGRCFISAALQGDTTYLCLVFGSPLDTEYNESFVATRTLCDWAFSSLKIISAVEYSAAVTEIKLLYASGRNSLVLYPEKTIPAMVNLNNEEGTVRYVFHLPENVKAPVSPGDVIGDADIYYAGRLIGNVRLVSRETVRLNAAVMLIDTIGGVLWSVPAKILYAVLLLVVLGYLFLFVPYIRKQEKKRRNSKRRL